VDADVNPGNADPKKANAKQQRGKEYGFATCGLQYQPGEQS
jgi:hypothetical protein